MITIGGAIVVVNAATQIGIRIICDRLLGNGHTKTNGFCTDHAKMASEIELLKEAHTEETRIEMMTKALEEALKRNNTKNS